MDFPDIPHISRNMTLLDHLNVSKQLIKFQTFWKFWSFPEKLSAKSWMFLACQARFFLKTTLIIRKKKNCDALVLRNVTRS